MEFETRGQENPNYQTGSESATIRRELEEALFANEGRLGNAFRGDGPKFSGRYNCEWEVETILSASPKSQSRTLSQSCKSSVNSLIRANSFSPPTIAHLEGLLELLEENLRNEAEVVKEQREAEETSRRYEQADLTGVYVYSLPTFLRVEQMTDPARYWFKVGMTETSSFRRVREQARQTGLPEDPVIYRVYQHPTKSPR